MACAGRGQLRDRAYAPGANSLSMACSCGKHRSAVNAFADVPGLHTSKGVRDPTKGSLGEIGGLARMDLLRPGPLTIDAIVGHTSPGNWALSPRGDRVAFTQEA